MSEDKDQQDKTEKATPTRIDKAREEGQIARSRELSTFMMLVGGIFALWVLGSFIRERLTIMMEETFRFDRGIGYDTTLAVLHLSGSMKTALIGISPFFLAMAIIAVVAPALLGGWVFSSKSLEPKLSKLNPISGLKRMFGMQLLVEFVKAIAKSLLVGSIAIFVLKADVGKVMAVSSMSLEQGMGTIFGVILKGCALIAFSLILVAAIDVPFQLHSHHKKLKMTKEEIKKEMKDTDGDPHIKAKIRAQQQAVARSRMMSKIPEADVIITNPTHYAVALKYGADATGAPRLIAKGGDAVALRIKALGEENNITLLEAPTLARALYWNVDLDEEIPEQLYTAVAEVLAWVYEIKRIDKEGGLAPDIPIITTVPVGMDQRPNAKNKKGF